MTGTLRFIVLLAVTGSFVSNAESTQQPAQLNVIVRFSADLSGSLITEAEQSAAHVFDRSRVPVEWRNCSARDGTFLNPTCEGAPAATDVVIHIVPRAQRAPDAVFGVAFVNGSGGA